MKNTHPRRYSFVIHEDREDDWELIGIHNGGLNYQNKRFSRFFKHIYPNGKVEYSDTNRVVKILTSGPYEGSTWWYSKLITDFCDKMFPIELPYSAPQRPYEFYCEDFLYNRKFGDFDTTGIFYVITPIGEVIPINRYFAEMERDKPFSEISERRYLARKKHAKKRKE